MCGSLSASHGPPWERAYVSEQISGLEAVEVSNTHGTFTLVKKENKWRLYDDNEAVLDEAAVDSFLERVSSINLDTYLGKEDESYGLDKPAATLMLTGKDGPVTIRFAAGNDEDSNYIAKSSASPYYVEVTEYAVEKILDIEKKALTAK